MYTNRPSFLAFFDWRINRLAMHVGDAIDKIEEIFAGQHPVLATQLTQILEPYATEVVERDASIKTSPQLRVVQGHLRRAKRILDQGTSMDDFDTWFNHNDGNPLGYLGSEGVV